MIAADTSILSDYFNGAANPRMDWLKDAMRQDDLYLPPPVVTELLSHRQLKDVQRAAILALPQLAIQPAFWQSAGELRLKIIRQGKKAKLGDALIAQVCIDHDVPLITADADFENFVPLGLRLAK
jgi:predicted nucleic acid-binding protein